MNEFDRILIEQGISLIPRVPGTKEPPAGFSYSDRWDGTKIAKLDEIASWSVHDRAAICGVNHLVTLDFDSMDAYSRFWGGQRLARDLPQETLCVRTSRGIQAWFFDYSQDLAKFKNVIDGKPAVEMEIFIRKHLAAVPNNTHPSGKKYLLLGGYTIARKDGIVSQSVDRLRSLHWQGTPYSDEGATPMKIGDLSDQIDSADIERMASMFATSWKPGFRNRFLLALAGYLIRGNVSEISAVALVNAIIDKTGDVRARQSAVSKVRYEYRNKDKIKRLQGVVSLKKIIMEVELSKCQM